MNIINICCYTLLVNLLILKMSYGQISDLPQVAVFNSESIRTERSTGKLLSERFGSDVVNTKPFNLIDRSIMVDIISEVNIEGVLHILRKLALNASGNKNLYQGVSIKELVELPLKFAHIGSQIWLVENLDVGHYRNGDPIPQVQDKDEWNSITYGAWCYCNNDSEHGRIYGKLYNWHAVNDPRGLAPKGWHVPTDREWKILENYLGLSQVKADAKGRRGTYEGDKLKSRNGWVENGNGSNSSGFSALPGGWRSSSNGRFGLVGGSAYFWSSSEDSSNSAWIRSLYFNGAYISRGSRNKQGGYSIRLIRD